MATTRMRERTRRCAVARSPPQSAHRPPAGRTGPHSSGRRGCRSRQPLPQHEVVLAQKARQVLRPVGRSATMTSRTSSGSAREGQRFNCLQTSLRWRARLRLRTRAPWPTSQDLHPPKEGVVLCVDEKTNIQALGHCHRALFVSLVLGVRPNPPFTGSGALGVTTCGGWLGPRPQNAGDPQWFLLEAGGLGPGL